MTNPISVLLVDDDETLLNALSQAFALEDIEVVPCRSAKEALSRLRGADCPFAVVSDVRMPEMDGIEFFQKTCALDPDIPFIFMTGHADVSMVLSTMRKGAYDFFPKPIDTEQLIVCARRAMKARELVLENRRLRTLSDRSVKEQGLLGETPVMERLRATIQHIAKTPVNVLVEGETGSGKGLVAELIHLYSDRSEKPFINVNCAALNSDGMLASLFGQSSQGQHYTAEGRRGQIARSADGILFLDDIDHASPELQGQLVPVIETGEVTTIDGDTTTEYNLRIIAASRSNSTELMEAPLFRNDLLFLINNVRLVVPPLRERKEDIPLLFMHFVGAKAEELRMDIPPLSPAVKRHLREHDWPGNVRELKNYAQSVLLGIDDTPEVTVTEDLSLPKQVEQFEANVIKAALDQSIGSVKDAADLLGVPVKTLYDKVARYKVDARKYRSD